MRKAIQLSIVLTVLLAPAMAVQASSGGGHSWDGSRVTPVHQVPIFNEHGSRINPAVSESEPFSTRKTCGACHNYEAISSGFHFNAATASGATSATAGRPGEPWIWIDAASGTQLPLSYRSWAGTYNPQALGMSAWDFTMMFGRHSPGGSVSDPADSTAEADGRWLVSGGLEINCLGCHNASPDQNQSRWALEILRENFRWAGTFSTGMATGAGMMSRLPGSWRMGDGFNVDDRTYAIPPMVEYDSNSYNANGQMNFRIGSKPDDRGCLYCHSVGEVGLEKEYVAGDIHTVSGMSCAHCHTNGIGHDIVRGYDTEAAEKENPHLKGFSCEGCHLGGELAEGEAPQAGRYGAPKPVHKDLPLTHLEKISCTTCHSGPWAGDEAKVVRTARANRLGIHGRATWATDSPQIVEPVFLKDENGKIAPYRMMWPAFFGKVEGEAVTPIAPDDMAAFTARVTDGEALVGAALGLLAKARNFPSYYPEIVSGTPVLQTGDKIYRTNADGALEAVKFDGKLATGTLWALYSEPQVLPLLADFQSLLGWEATMPFWTDEVQKNFFADLDMLTPEEKTKIMADTPDFTEKDKWSFYAKLEGYKSYIIKSPDKKDRYLEMFETSKAAVRDADEVGGLVDRIAGVLTTLGQAAKGEGAVPALFYGSEVFYLGAEGEMVRAPKAGPRQSEAVWGTFDPKGDTRPAKMSDATVIAALQGLDAQFDALRQEAIDADEIMAPSFTVYVNGGKLQRLGAKGALVVYETDLELPESGLPFLRVFEPTLRGLLPAFDSAIEDPDTLDSEYPKAYEALMACLQAIEPQNYEEGLPTMVWKDKKYISYYDRDFGIDKMRIEKHDYGTGFDIPTFGFSRNVDFKPLPNIPLQDSPKVDENQAAFTPLIPAHVPAALAQRLGTMATLTEEEVALVLENLAASDAKAKYAYIAQGKMFTVADGKLTASDHEAAQPYKWAIAHDVRPAAQSLGAKSCEDCHVTDAPYFAGKITPLGPLVTAQVKPQTILEMRGTTESVKYRNPLFTKIGWGFAGLIIVTMTLLVLHMIADTMRRRSRRKAA